MRTRTLYINPKIVQFIVRLSLVFRAALAERIPQTE